MFYNPHMYQTMPLGIIVRRSPGVSRWADFSWKAIAVLPGARQANWHVLRRQGDITEFHAATVTLELHGAETDAYLHGLGATPPGVYVVFSRSGQTRRPFDVLLVTASPYEAQDYIDSGEELVEKVPMPEGLVAWVRDFANAHHKDVAFKKRRRDRQKIDAVQDGVGDPRIVQTTDVYRSPALTRRERLPKAKGLR